MGSACTIITVGTTAPVCTGSTACAPANSRECRDDGYYWDCLDGCWKKSPTSCKVDPCTIDPCGSTCTDCSKCPSLAKCDPCVSDPCGTKCTDCTKCPSKASCQLKPDPCLTDPCGFTCAGYPNCAQCSQNPGCTTPDPCISNPCGSTCKDCTKCPTLPSCPVDPCIANPCLSTCNGYMDCTICPTTPGCAAGTDNGGGIEEEIDTGIEEGISSNQNQMFLLFGLALLGGIVIMGGRR